MTPRTRRAHWRTDTHRFRYNPDTQSIVVWEHRSRRRLVATLDDVIAAATAGPQSSHPAPEDPRQIPMPFGP